jgi:hypothetical protein
VSEFVERGMPAAHEAMMQNAGGMMHGHGVGPGMAGRGQ